jgi:hypothetical protein
MSRWLSNALWLASTWCLATPNPGVAQTRELRWKSLEVHARLDDAGALHVDERHVTEFTGNWNGGERVFQLNDGQAIEVRGMSRIDPSTGARTELVRGDLSQVDHYNVNHTDEQVTLRWRVRARDAPPLRHAKFVHIVSYVHHGVAQAEDADVFSIAHDFSFERPGPLDTISVTLEVDRASWQPIGTLRAVSRGRNLAHDASFVVRAKLAWIGSGHPPTRAHVELTPRSVSAEGWALLLLLLLGPVLLAARRIRDERRRGRLARLEPARANDSSWRADHCLRHPPELVSLLWPSAEPPWPRAHSVAALLARLELEGTIATRVIGDQLTMSLLVDRSQLAGHERAVVDGFFFDGDVTSSASIKRHYKSTGFHPAHYLAELRALASRLLGPPREAKVERLLNVIVGLLGCYLLLQAPGHGPQRLAIATIPGGFLCFVAAAFAGRWRAHLEWGARELSEVLLVAALPVVAAAAHITALELEPPWGASLGGALLALSYFSVALGSARTRDSAEGLVLRRGLCSFRLYVEERLGAGHNLPNELVPYVLAFGLGEDASAWTVAGQGVEGLRAGSTERADYRVRPQPPEPTVVDSAATFEGGGGTFGGAGATGEWVNAVGAVSCGVAAPSTGSSSSSASSSNTSSSGSSSGGGRAGGW